MSNVCWITFARSVTADEVTRDLLTLVQRRFGGTDALRLTYAEKGYWEFDDEAHGYVSITLTSPTRVTFKPGADDSYAETVLRNELGALYDATCGGEFDDEATWKPEPERFSSREKYLKEISLRDAD